MAGKLMLCATPIGNLEDITLRVLRALREADLIAAEDTRNSKKLLNHFDIHTPVTSYHEHNRASKGPALIARMEEGQTVALITDAGTPAISDPGEDLVRLACEAGIEVTSLPGASAAVTALTLAGIPVRRFAFEGFLPAQGKDRRQRIDELAKETRTIVLYEAPHRILRTLADLAAALGSERRIAVCRELTKIHETVLRMTIGEAAAHYEAEEPRGEFVLVVDGKSEEAVRAEASMRYDGLSLPEHMDQYLAAGLDRKEAMRRVAKDRGVSRREIYNQLEAKKGKITKNS